MIRSVPEIDVAGARTLLRAGALLVDVRTPAEWDAGHAPDAVHVPLETVPAQASALPRDRVVVVICRSGRRSQAAVAELGARGFDAHNLTGGMLAWVQAGLPVVSASGAAPAVI